MLVPLMGNMSDASDGRDLGSTPLAQDIGTQITLSYCHRPYV